MSKISNEELTGLAISKLEELAADRDTSVELTAGMPLEAVEEDLRQMGLDPNKGLPQEIKQIISKNVRKQHVTNASTLYGSQALKRSGNIYALGRATLKTLYSLFPRPWAPIQLLLAGVGLAMALYYGYALMFSLINTHRSVAMMLTGRLESAGNADQGISVLLLSSVKDDWAKPEYLNVRDLNSVLQDINAKVREVDAREKSEEAVRRNGGREGTHKSITDLINQ